MFLVFELIVLLYNTSDFRSKKRYCLYDTSVFWWFATFVLAIMKEY